MHNFLTKKTADCNILFDILGSEDMPITGNRKQIVHAFPDGRTAVVNLSESFFEVDVRFDYLSDTDKGFILDCYHNTAKADGGDSTFYWLNHRDGMAYVARFLTPIRTVFEPGLLQSVNTIKLRISGYFGQAYSEYTDMALYVESGTYMHFI